MLSIDLSRVSSRNQFSGPSTSTSDQAQMHIQPKFAAMTTHLLMFLSSTDGRHGSRYYLLKKKKKKMKDDEDEKENLSFYMEVLLKLMMNMVFSSFL